MSSLLDPTWERLKARFPALADADVVRDQSHGHHALHAEGIWFRGKFYPEGESVPLVELP